MAEGTRGVVHEIYQTCRKTTISKGIWAEGSVVARPLAVSGMTKTSPKGSAAKQTKECAFSRYGTQVPASSQSPSCMSHWMQNT